MQHSAMTSMNMQQHQGSGKTVLWSEWSGRNPGKGKPVVIPDGLTVVLDSEDIEVGDLVVHGTVKFGKTDVSLMADNIVVFGEMQAGTENDPHTHKAKITLTGKSTDPDVVLSELMGGGHHSGNGGHSGHHMSNPIDNKALIVAPGGKLNLHGAEVNSWTQLGSTAAAGDTSIELAGALTGWNIGDMIAIAPTDFNVFEAEERTITRIEGSTVFLDQPLAYKHYGEQQDLGNGKLLDMRAEVTNLSRNIVITGSEEGETKIDNSTRSNPDYFTRSGYGGHTVYMKDAEVNIDGVEFSRLGNSGELGNYPVHFHHTGDASKSSFRNSSIHHTFQRGLVVHQTNNLLIDSNTVYDTMSHSYFLEDGIETGNKFVNNLAMLPRSTPSKFRIDNPNKDSRKFERASAFWITNPSNSFEGNHAVGVPSGQGFWFVDPDDASGTGASKKNPLNDLPLQKFEGNTAHTIMFDQYSPGNLGYRFNWTGNALEFGEEVTNQAANATVKDFTAWKIGNMAIQMGPTRTLTIENPILAEARIMIQSDSRGRKPGKVPIKIIDATLVPETENTVEGRDMKAVFPKKFVGPVVAESARPVEFIRATVVGEEDLDYSKEAKYKNQLTFKNTQVFQPTNNDSGNDGDGADSGEVTDVILPPVTLPSTPVPDVDTPSTPTDPTAEKPSTPAEPAAEEPSKPVVTITDMAQEGAKPLADLGSVKKPSFIGGGRGNNVLIGGAGNQKIYGRDGDDVLVGVDADALLAGAGERDVLSGDRGKDTYVLGDADGAFYDDGNAATLGEHDLAIIRGFTHRQDTIELHGKVGDYRLGASFTGGVKGLGIFLTSSGEDELIAVLQNRQSKNYRLTDSTIFKFV
ncbi:MAG: G8 domain-containing protein [Cyanobacteria bacterium J06597_16]